MTDASAPWRESTSNAELVLYHFIDELFTQSSARELVLGGGFAMRHHFEIERAVNASTLLLSPDVSRERLDRLIHRAFRHAASVGGIGDTRLAPGARDTGKAVEGWVFEGEVNERSRVKVGVDIIRRPLSSEDYTLCHLSPGVEIFSTGRTPRGFMVEMLNAPTLAAATLACLHHDRNSTICLLDLDAMIQAGIAAPTDALIGWWNPEELESYRAGLPNRMDRLSWSQFRREALPLFPPPLAGEWNEQRFVLMKNRVGEAADEWLEQAIEANDDSARQGRSP